MWESGVFPVRFQPIALDYRASCYPLEKLITGSLSGDEKIAALTNLKLLEVTRHATTLSQTFEELHVLIV